MGLFGGSDDKAQKQDEAQQQQQQQDIQDAISKINGVFDDPARQQQYDDLQKSTTDYYTQDVNNQEAVNARKLKFSLARQGLVGGSQQAVEGKQLTQDYDKAILQASQQGQSAAANLRSADEQSRNNLIAQAEAGLTAGDAGTQATTSLYNNLLSGQAGATANSLVNSFGDISDIYNASQNQKAAQQGALYGFGGLFSNPNGSGYGAYGG